MNGGIILQSDQAETGDKNGDQGLTWSQGLGLQNLFHWQGVDSASPDAMESKRRASATVESPNTFPWVPQWLSGRTQIVFSEYA